MSAETFEQVVAASQTSGDYNPTWKRFVKTLFFVPLARGAADPGRQFKLAKHPQSGKTIVTIAEDRQLLEERGENAAHLHGAEIIKLLSDEVGILVALTDRSFGIPAGLVARLKQSLEASAKAKAAAAVKPAPASAPAVAPAANGGFPSLDISMLNTQQAASEERAKSAAPAPAPAPAPVAASMGLSLQAMEKAGAPAPAPAPAASTYLDVAALKPRNVGLPHLGIDFYVPGAWKELKSGRALQFQDPATGLMFDAAGMTRPGRTVEQWVEMRTPLVLHDMPYLQQVGPSYAIEGQEWRGMISARAAEFRGTAPGDSEESACLLCCFRTETTLFAITMSAKARVFEASRPLFKWLLPRVSIAEQVGEEVEEGGSGTEEVDHAGRVGSGLRMIMLAILLNVGFLSQANSVHPMLLFYVALCVAGFGCFGMFRLAQGLQFSLFSKIVLFVGMFVPLLSLVLLVIVSRKARRFLREQGHSVGFFGWTDAVPESNHDLRNVLIVALLSALAFYGLARFADKRMAAREPVEFSPPDHSFSVMMRGTPTERDSVSNNPGSHLWSSGPRDKQYLAGYNELNRTIADPALALGLVANEYANALANGSQGAKGTVNSSTRTEVDGYPARKIVATLDNGEFATTEYVLAGQRLYIFTIDVTEKDKDSPDIEHFLDSISIAGDGK